MNHAFSEMFAPPSVCVVWGIAGGYLYMSRNLELYLAYCQIGEVEAAYSYYLGVAPGFLPATSRQGRSLSLP